MTILLKDAEVSYILNNTLTILSKQFTFKHSKIQHHYLTIHVIVIILRITKLTRVSETMKNLSQFHAILM